MDEQQRLRQDPELVKPVDILVRGGYGPLMLKEEAGVLDSFARDENVRALTENLSTKWSLRGGGKAVPAFFNSIVGIVPLREQLENYNAAFIGAAEYEVDRDFPRYSGVKIERREVGTQEWVALDAMKKMTIGPESWSSVAESDVVASKYYSPDFVKPVVMEIPPVAGVDMDAFVSHPRLQTEAEADKQAELEEEARTAKEKADELAAKASGSPVGGHNAGGTESMTEEEIAFSKLAATGDIGMFRYFDFEVEPGKSYEYRVQLVLEDPNNPHPDSGVKPSQGALDPTVLVRLSDSVSSESLSTRETEWTDPTQPVRVPNPGRALVSTTTAGSTIGRSQIPALGDSGEPKATVVAIGFDVNNGYVVPVEMEVVRGMVLNSQQDTEVIDPSQNRLVKLEDYSNTTNIIVVDIAGGKLVGGGRRDEVRSPGKVLMVAPDGSFIVSDEIGDAEDYASSVVLPNEEKVAPVREAPEPERNNRRGGRNGGGRGGRGGGPRGNEERAL